MTDQKEPVPTPDEPQGEPEIVDESTETGPPKRRKIRVRKRIRIRKKSSFKKKLKKYAEKAFWVLIVAAFITALIVMFSELDIKDERLKKGKNVKKNSRSY